MANLDIEGHDVDRMQMQELQKEYVVPQQVVYFDYIGIMCTVVKSQFYYDCAFMIHVWITALPKVRRPQAVQVAECTKMNRDGVWSDPDTQTHHKLN